MLYLVIIVALYDCIKKIMMLDVMFLKQFIGVFVILNLFQGLDQTLGYDCIKRPKVRYPFCEDKNEARRGHTMCLGGIRQHLMNEKERLAITRMHHTIRTMVNPPASNMIKLEYNSLLEKEAQIWAERCEMTHDRDDLRFLADRFSVGQNIAVGGPVLNWAEVLQLWESEKAVFKFGGSNGVAAVGNYTQMIWAETYLLGCGVSKCGTNHFYVCNYAPSMNVTELSTPYIASSGSWCDSCMVHCDNVTSKQCDCLGKLCLNGGQLNLTTCTCDCIKEVNTYDPLFCALICNSAGDDPLCGNHPYQNSTCGNNSLTNFHCPWMCNICPYGDANYTESSVLLPWERGLPVCTTSTSMTTTESAAYVLTSTVPRSTSSHDCLYFKSMFLLLLIVHISQSD